MDRKCLFLNTKFIANSILQLAKCHNFKMDLQTLNKIIINAERHFASDKDIDVINEKWAEIKANGETFAGYESISPEGWKRGAIENYAPVSTGEIYTIPYSNEFYPYLAFSFYKIYGEYSQPI